jgi:hypothetical protein
MIRRARTPKRKSFAVRWVIALAVVFMGSFAAWEYALNKLHADQVFVGFSLLQRHSSAYPAVSCADHLLAAGMLPPAHQGYRTDARRRLYDAIETAFNASGLRLGEFLYPDD